MTVPAPAPRPAWPVSALVLVAANAVPLVGVAFLGWSVFALMLLFWCENVTVGAFNVLRMLCARGAGVAGFVGSLFLVPFFCVHYGMFTFIHGIFVLALFGGSQYATGWGPAMFAHAVAAAHIEGPCAVLVASHAFSFYWNYLKGGEYRTATPLRLMAAPYGRVMVLHFVIIFGGMLATVTGAPAAALALLVILKTMIDLRAHLREHTTDAHLAAGVVAATAD